MSQENLLQHNKALMSVIRQLPGCIFWKDKRLVYLGCNLNLAALSGREKPENVIGKSDFDMPWHERAEEVRAADTYVIQNDKTISFKEEITSANGWKVFFLTTKRALKIDEEIVGIIGNSVDITEQETWKLSTKSLCVKLGKP